MLTWLSPQTLDARHTRASPCQQHICVVALLLKVLSAITLAGGTRGGGSWHLPDPAHACFLCAPHLCHALGSAAAVRQITDPLPGVGWELMVLAGEGSTSLKMACEVGHDLPCLGNTR